MRKARELVVSVGMHEQMKSGLATGSCDGSDVIARVAAELIPAAYLALQYLYEPADASHRHCTPIKLVLPLDRASASKSHSCLMYFSGSREDNSNGRK